MGFSLFQSQTSPEHWSDWQWQQRNAIRGVGSLHDAFPGLNYSAIDANLQDRKLQITPYFADLIRKSIAQTGCELNPLMRQVIPYWDEEPDGGYDAQTDNWELAHEMKTPICQHKYDNRVILRIANVCNAYCQFCFEALRTIDLKAGKQTLKPDSWKDTIAYIKVTPEIEEVILSGGEPLMVNDQKLERYLDDLRSIGSELLIRLHTRALSFNPYRITDKLIDMLDRYKVNAVGVHVCHPSEISDEFHAALQKIQRVVPITFANIPLLAKVNDDYEILCKLFFDLYRIGVVPYYLYHYMPFSPGSGEYGSSVTRMIQIMKRIKRHKSNIAVPEYVLPHAKGKFTVPLLEKTDRVPSLIEGEHGAKYYQFENWQGETCHWREVG